MAAGGASRRASAVAVATRGACVERWACTPLVIGRRFQDWTRKKTHDRSAKTEPDGPPNTNAPLGAWRVSGACSPKLGDEAALASRYEVFTLRHLGPHLPSRACACGHLEGVNGHRQAVSTRLHHPALTPPQRRRNRLVDVTSPAIAPLASVHTPPGQLLAFRLDEPPGANAAHPGVRLLMRHVLGADYPHCRLPCRLERIAYPQQAAGIDQRTHPGQQAGCHRAPHPAKRSAPPCPPRRCSHRCRGHKQGWQRHAEHLEQTLERRARELCHAFEQRWNRLGWICRRPIVPVLRRQGDQGGWCAVLVCG